MAQGLVISQAGNDVGTASTEDLVFDSRTDGSFKISNIYTVSFNSASVSAGTVAHGLGYVPAFFSIVQTPSLGTFVAPYLNPGVGILKVYANSTNIVARAITLDAGTHTFKIVVFKEKIV